MNSKYFISNHEKDDFNLYFRGVCVYVKYITYETVISYEDKTKKLKMICKITQ